jgi:hypothetical protein
MAHRAKIAAPRVAAETPGRPGESKAVISMPYPSAGNSVQSRVLQTENASNARKQLQTLAQYASAVTNNSTLSHRSNLALP